MRRTRSVGRLTLLLVAAGLVALPAAVLRAFCVGRSCDAPAEARTRAPFCGLPAATRRDITAGFRDGRSPDVLAVTGGTPVASGDAGGRHARTPWPSVGGRGGSVPLVFWGTGVAPSRLGRGARLDAVALRSRPAMTALVKRAGSPVEFVGFVDRATGMPADEFYLTRFLVSCCAADAVSLRVRVVGAPPGELRQDRWVTVSGRIYPLLREVIVHASAVTPVKRPERPYLNG